MYVRDTQQTRTEDNKYLELEMRLLKIIEDSASDERGIMSVHELVSSLEALDPFTLKMQILTLEGKGLLKKTELGYSLTKKGKERIHNKDKIFLLHTHIVTDIVGENILCQLNNNNNNKFQLSF
jgi:predicted transcriptional regulator